MMADVLPAVVPQCAEHGSMTLRPGKTEIDRWCGAWYDCTFARPRCGNSVLIPSAGLRAQLDEQRAKVHAATPARRRRPAARVPGEVA